MPDTITVRPDGLRIVDLTITDPAVVGQAQTVPEDRRAAWARTAIVVGARAIGMASPSQDAVEARAGLDRLAHDVTLHLGERVSSATVQLEALSRRSSEHVAAAVETQIGRLASGVQTVLRDTDGILRQQLEGTLSQGIAALRAALRDDAEATRTAFAAGVADLQASLAVEGARARVADRTHLKGLPFETQVRAALEAIGGLLGYAVEDTTLVTGEVPGAKKGDFLLCCNDSDQGSIVVEAKAGGRLTSARWRSLLRDAVANRGAAAAVGVVPSTDMLDGRSLAVISPTAVVVAFDPVVDEPGELLAAAIAIVRAAAAAEATAALAAGPEGVLLTAAVDGLVRGVEALGPVSRQAVTLRRSATELAAALDAARAELHARVADVGRLMQSPTGVAS